MTPEPRRGCNRAVLGLAALRPEIICRGNATCPWSLCRYWFRRFQEPGNRQLRRRHRWCPREVLITSYRSTTQGEPSRTRAALRMLAASRHGNKPRCCTRQYGLKGTGPRRMRKNDIRRSGNTIVFEYSTPCGPDIEIGGVVAMRLVPLWSWWPGALGLLSHARGGFRRRRSGVVKSRRRGQAAPAEPKSGTPPGARLPSDVTPARTCRRAEYGDRGRGIPGIGTVGVSKLRFTAELPLWRRRRARDASVDRVPRTERSAARSCIGTIKHRF